MKLLFFTPKLLYLPQYNNASGLDNERLSNYNQMAEFSDFTETYHSWKHSEPLHKYLTDRHCYRRLPA